MCGRRAAGFLGVRLYRRTRLRGGWTTFPPAALGGRTSARYCPVVEPTIWSTGGRRGWIPLVWWWCISLETNASSYQKMKHHRRYYLTHINQMFSGCGMILTIVQWFETTCLELGIYFFIVWYIFSDNMAITIVLLLTTFKCVSLSPSFHSHSKYNHCDFELLTKSILKWAWLIFVCVCVRVFKGAAPWLHGCFCFS